jgi:hypothetical protein
LAPACTVPWRVGAFRQAHELPTAWLVRQEMAALPDGAELFDDDDGVVAAACAGAVGV